MEIDVGEEVLRELWNPWFNLFISFKGFGGIQTIENGGNIKSTIEHNFDLGSDA